MPKRNRTALAGVGLTAKIVGAAVCVALAVATAQALGVARILTAGGDEEWAARAWGIVGVGWAVAAPVLALGTWMLVLFVRGQVARPLFELAEAIRTAMLNEGDLTRRVDSERLDEIGVIANTCDAWAQQVRARVRVMKDVAAKAEALARQVEEAREEEASRDGRAGIGGAPTDDLLALTANAMDLAQRAERAERVVVAYRERGEAVSRQLREGTDDVRALGEALRALAERERAAIAHGEALERAVGALDDAADRANLLALNAAIEAARAGEAGLAFGGVAEELRAVGERTERAIQDLSTHLRAWREEAERSTAGAREQAESGAHCVTRAASTAEAVGAHAAGVGSILEALAGARTRSHEQARALEELARVITQERTERARPRDGEGEAIEAAARLAREMERVRQVVGGFRV